jgi:uncharacterized Zn finger protein (UPF0148 family)
MTDPKILNVVCPQCALAWMVPLNHKTYFCPACQFVLLEKQITEEMKSAIYN